MVRLASVKAFLFCDMFFARFLCLLFDVECHRYQNLDILYRGFDNTTTLCETIWLCNVS